MTKAEVSLGKKMESLRLICEREIPIQQQKMDSFVASFRMSLDSIKSRAEETVQNQGKLGEMKASLREAEDDYVKVLAVKTRKEAKQMATRDSVSAAKARIEELKRIVQVQRARRDEYATVISQQSLALATFEEKGNQGVQHKQEIEEAISWYNRVLGFQIEGGHGVKFTFSNINSKNPYEEYSFTIRHENDTYSLLGCDPHLNDTKELVNELNRTNGLFKFVRIMRARFQEAAASGLLPQSPTLCQDTSTISVSAPVLSVSTDGSESADKKIEHKAQHGEVDRHFKKASHVNKENEHQIQHEGKRYSKNANLGRGTKTAALSPVSAISPRRSPRFKVKK